MNRLALVFVVSASLLAGCSGGGESCAGSAQWSTATSGGLCQVNIFTTPEQAVYCAEKADGTFDCACGPIADNPTMFTSADFCKLDGEERVCAAVEQCGFAVP